MYEKSYLGSHKVLKRTSILTLIENCWICFYSRENTTQTGKLDKNFRFSRAKNVACARVLEIGARQQTKLLAL